MAWSRPLPRLLLAGLWLSACEVLLVVLFDRRLFLSETELRRYLVAGASVPAAVLVVLGGATWFGAWRLWRGGAGRRALGLTVAGVAALTSAAVLWLSTDGRRLRDLPLRPVLVVALALITGWLALGAVRALQALLEHGVEVRRRRVAIAAALLAAALLALDSLLLRRLYPALHVGLALGALGLAGVAGLVWPAARAGTRNSPTGARLGLVALIGLAVGSLLGLRAAPNARFAVALAAPLTGKVLALVPNAARHPVAPAPGASASMPAPTPQAGVDLRGRDVLLITIDALRADRLRALGGQGVTPELDRLAEESVVFERAYTPTPHTSYALSSLFTGKFLRQVLSLPNAPAEHPALPELLREHGFRTAAFYPPAVFFVDAERFKTLSERRFGFEYAKEMFAPGSERVRQLERYLSEADPRRLLFVWVHLFEPHEPYDPPPRFARGDSPLERYDGEVAAADAAAGELIRAFRRARPNATVIVTSDHGEEFGEHGGTHHGTSLFDEQVRVPLVWSAPGKLTPRRVTRPVNLVDVAPSLLSALGIPRDARMRGQELGPWLAGAAPATGQTTFASIDELRMVTDGVHKLLCDPAAGGCRLFDLAGDPFERNDASEAQPDVMARLQQVLSDFVGSIPRVEAMEMQGGGGWPEALARAALGDPRSAPDVVPLLGSSRAEVRAEAARRLGELGHASALATLASLRERDPHAGVRAEAALACLRLGDGSAAASSAALLGTDEPNDLRRRAALVLSGKGEAASGPVLLEWATDAEAPLPERRAAVVALGELRSAASVPGLTALLDDVNLRVPAVQALERVGSPAAARALVRALERERYPQPRQAEASALVALKERRAAPLIWRWLGTPSSMPGGVELLAKLGALSPPSGRGALVVEAARAGLWQCTADGCEPGQGAQLRLPRRSAPRGAVRVTFRVRAARDGSRLRVGGQDLPLAAGLSEVGAELPGPSESLALEASPGVTLLALAVAAVTEDLPPPPPEPWQAAASPDPTP